MNHIKMRGSAHRRMRCNPAWYCADPYARWSHVGKPL